MNDDPFAFLGEPVAPTDARSMVPTWFLDEFQSGAPEYEIAQAFAYHMISEFQKPKTMKTVRRRLLTNTEFLHRLAEIHPEIFDEVICAYSERALIFENPNAA